MLSPTLQFPQNAIVSTVRLEPWETSLAAFLRVRWSGDVDSQRRQAQEFVDKLDVVRDYARPLGYSRFTDHAFRLSITGVFTDKTKTVSEVSTEVVWRLLHSPILVRTRTKVHQVRSQVICIRWLLKSLRRNVQRSACRNQNPQG